jgi:hypothetical protein
VQVRDFEELRKIYETQVNHTFVEQAAQDYGTKIKHQLGFNWPWLDSAQSKFTLDLYNETMMMNRTYFTQPDTNNV